MSVISAFHAVCYGNSNVLNNLGKFYEKWIGVDRNFDKSIEYYKKAADLGNQFAIDKLKSFNKK